MSSTYNVLQPVSGKLGSLSVCNYSEMHVFQRRMQANLSLKRHLILLHHIICCHTQHNRYYISSAEETCYVTASQGTFLSLSARQLKNLGMDFDAEG